MIRTAAKAKVRLHVLKRHGRWKSDAAVLCIVDDEGENYQYQRRSWVLTEIKTE